MRCSWQEIGIGRAYRSHANWPVYRGERRCIVGAFHHDQTATRPKRYSKIYCTNNLYNWRATKKRECTPIRLRIQTVITSRQRCRRWISWVFLSGKLNFAGHCRGYTSDRIMKGMSISRYFTSRLAGYWEKSGVVEGEEERRHGNRSAPRGCCKCRAFSVSYAALSYRQRCRDTQPSL